MTNHSEAKSRRELCFRRRPDSRIYVSGLWIHVYERVLRPAELVKS